MTIKIVNKSTIVNNTQFQQIITAMNVYLAQVCQDWGFASVNLISGTPSDNPNNVNTNTIFVFDNTDSPGALGYHYEINGFAVGEVFAKTITGYYGNNAILYVNQNTPTLSSVLCHELLEMLGNQYANKWCMDKNGILWAAELCDPVQNNIYTITLPGTSTKIALSDYVMPNWFIPDATLTTGKFNKMNTLSAPFTVKSGYAIQIKNYRVIAVYGEQFPDNQKTDVQKDLQSLAKKYNMSVL